MHPLRSLAPFPHQCRGGTFFLLMLAVAFLASGGIAAAQGGVFSEDPQATDGGGGMFDLNSLPAKIAIVLLVFLLTSLFLFLVLYGMLVERLRWWPMSAYGLVAGMVVLCVTGAVLYAFWNDLVFPPSEDAADTGDTWWGLYGPKVIVAAVGVGLFAVFAYWFKSPKGVK